MELKEGTAFTPASDAATGMVFDIQRFALHDGSGIRTTVFLKGCPLQCVWCHNPESQAFGPELSFRSEKACGCPACTAAATGSLKVADVFPDQTLGPATPCRTTVACSSGALEVIGRQMTVSEVMDVVLRDVPYYHSSGGGITLSGGEPLAQFAFARELLRAAKVHGLHTCLDTCGHARWDYVQAVMDDVDLFLYDFKAADASEHRRLTGVSNALILRNLDFLYRMGGRILLRCPLIPGVNDTDHHLRSIAGLAERYPDLAGVEIMPYHNMGRDKAVRIGRPAPLPDVATASEEQKAAWMATLVSYGCERAFIS